MKCLKCLCVLLIALSHSGHARPIDLSKDEVRLKQYIVSSLETDGKEKLLEHIIIQNETAASVKVFIDKLLKMRSSEYLTVWVMRVPVSVSRGQKKLTPKELRGTVVISDRINNVSVTLSYRIKDKGVAELYFRKELTGGILKGSGIEE